MLSHFMSGIVQQLLHLQGAFIQFILHLSWNISRLFDYIKGHYLIYTIIVKNDFGVQRHLRWP